MSLVIEDGTGLPDSNSFVDLVEVREFAANRGLEFPADDPEAEAAIVKGADFIRSVEFRFTGRRVSPTQSLPWPRIGAWLNGFSVAPDHIPDQLKLAQCQLAVDSSTIDLNPTTNGRAIIREKIGDLETEYSDTGHVPSPDPDLAVSLLAPLFKGGGTPLSTVRI